MGYHDLTKAARNYLQRPFLCQAVFVNGISGKIINVNGLKSKLDLRIWLDIGTEEGQKFVADVKELRDAFVKKGWVLNSDLIYFEAKGGSHNEESFAQRVKPMLKHLFPKQTSRSMGM